MTLGTIFLKIYREDQYLHSAVSINCTRGLIFLLFQHFGLIWGLFEHLGCENRKYNKNTTE